VGLITCGPNDNARSRYVLVRLTILCIALSFQPTRNAPVVFVGLSPGPYIYSYFAVERIPAYSLSSSSAPRNSSALTQRLSRYSLASDRNSAIELR